LTKPPKQANI